MSDTCSLCDEPILAGDVRAAIGQPTHRECLFRSVYGGVYHQMKLCSCFGGTLGHVDPPGLTQRQAAQLSEAWHRYKL